MDVTIRGCAKIFISTHLLICMKNSKLLLKAGDDLVGDFFA